MRSVARRARSLLAFVLAAVVSPTHVVTHAQEYRFFKGQTVAPVYEGWQRKPDGSIVMFFGYMNRNYEETPDIPIGPNNFFEPGAADRGQPTHFLPRRHYFVFQVTVPKDWDPKRRLTWSLTVNGKTETVQGWLQPEWYADDGVIQMNIGPGGTPPTNPPNTPPRITGSPAQTVALSSALTLTASATDDGVPRNRRGRGGAPLGLDIRWIHYRGAGTVTFGTPRASAELGKPVEATTTVRFSAEGTYVLRAIASDGLFETPHDVPVTVR
jgi:hypothetical protein